MKKKIFVILGNQLFNLSFFLKFKKDHIFFLSEDLGLCTYEKHHKQKILLFLSAMRSFRDELENNGFEVIYKKIEDDDFKEAYMVKLKKLIKEMNINSVSVFEIEDKPFEKKFLSELKNYKSITDDRLNAQVSFQRALKNNALIKSGFRENSDVLLPLYQFGTN